MWQDIQQDDQLDTAPYLGGFNADKAELVIVNFSPDPTLYKVDHTTTHPTAAKISNKQARGSSKS